MCSPGPQAADALSTMITNSRFSLTVHSQSQGPCSTPVKNKHNFILLPTALIQIAVLRLRPCWLWTAAAEEHLDGVLLYLQVLEALLLIIKPFLVTFNYFFPIFWWASIAVIACNQITILIYHSNCHLMRKDLGLKELSTLKNFGM